MFLVRRLSAYLLEIASSAIAQQQGNTSVLWTAITGDEVARAMLVSLRC